MGLIEDIKSLKIQGASMIAVESLKYLDKFSQKNGFGKDFEIEAKKIQGSRPTAVVIHNVIEILLKSRNSETIENLIERIENDERQIGFHGRKLIKNGYQVHTHCHSTEALAVIKESAKHNKITVVVDETRPRNQGFITANELSTIRNITVFFGTDSSAGAVLLGRHEKKDDIVIVGADSMRKDGFYNKTGTYMLAVAANENSIPLFVAASTLKLDRRKNIEIEQRPPEEVWKVSDSSIKVRNPAFDFIPWKYVAGVITEKGIMKPERIAKIII